jgi:hypothetical protein
MPMIIFSIFGIIIGDAKREAEKVDRKPERPSPALCFF